MQFSIPEYWSGKPSYPILERVLPNPGIEPRSPSLQADYLLAEPQGKPKNTGVSSLCLLQQIFLTQELNQGLLHCRWILNQLSYQGSPKVRVKVAQSLLTLCNPMDYTVHGILQARIQDQLSLLQGIFLTQGSNPGFPHCGWIFY